MIEPVRWLIGVLAAWGALMAAVTFTPLCYGWATRLAVHWPNQPAGDVLIVLTGDALSDGTVGIGSYWRSVYATRVWRETHARRVVISGDPKTVAGMAEFLKYSGVPAVVIELEDQSHNTHESALNLAERLRGERGRMLLVTSDYHMYRTWHALKQAGVEAEPCPLPDARKRIGRYAERWPVFWQLVTETAGIAYYAWRGWLA